MPRKAVVVNCNLDFKDDSGHDCQIGTISWGTLHPQHLFIAFQSECVRRNLLDKNTVFLTDIICGINHDDSIWQSESIDQLIAEFMEKLDSGLPEGIIFGCLEGDDTDLGYWRQSNE